MCAMHLVDTVICENLINRFKFNEMNSIKTTFLMRRNSRNGLLYWTQRLNLKNSHTHTHTHSAHLSHFQSSKRSIKCFVLSTESETQTMKTKL